jgi:hypothetical protein
LTAFKFYDIIDLSNERKRGIAMNTMVEMRMDFINQFDHYIRNEIGDEDIIDFWLTMGLPDGADTAEIREIAEYEETWLDMVNCFARCCRCAGVIE